MKFFIGAVGLTTGICIGAVGFAQDTTPTLAEGDLILTRPATKLTVSTASSIPTNASVSSWPTGQKLIALTFDDGPHPTITPKMVQLLESKGAKGTFFVSGASMSAFKTTAQNWLTRPGMEIANHTWTHPQLSKSTPEKVNSELARTATIVTEVTGKKMELMRPPYGATNAKTNEIIRSQGYVPVLWDIDTSDWRKRSADQIAQQILSEAHDGAIVLMHDRYETDVIALASVIDTLKANGYRFVTVSEMLAYPRTKPMPKQQVAKSAIAKPKATTKTPQKENAKPKGNAKPHESANPKPKSIQNNATLSSANYPTTPIATPIPSPTPTPKSKFSVVPKMFRHKD